jgi:hypothetical protein
LQKTIGKTKNARVEGAEPLNPLDMIKMHQVLMSSNSIHDLMVWTMFLLQVKLFLRCDELIWLKFSKNFIPMDIDVMNRQGLATISKSRDSQDIGSNDRRDVGKVGSLGGPGHI